MPYLGSVLNILIGGETVDSIYKQRKEAYKELFKLDKQSNILEEDEKCLKALLKSGFLKEEDKDILIRDLFKNKQDILDKRENIIKILKEHLEINDPFNNKNK
jgi:F0F1-type ATP synthase delta subunit